MNLTESQKIIKGLIVSQNYLTLVFQILENSVAPATISKAEQGFKNLINLLKSNNADEKILENVGGAESMLEEMKLGFKQDKINYDYLKPFKKMKDLFMTAHSKFERTYQ